MKKTFIAWFLVFSLTSCTPKSSWDVTKSAITFTSEVQVTRTLDVTSTPTHIPTKTPTTFVNPDFLNPPEDSIITANGEVLKVKNESDKKPLLIQILKEGGEQEVNIENFVFQSTLGKDGAPVRKMIKELYPEYFASGIMLKKLIPEKLMSDSKYKQSVTNGWFVIIPDHYSYLSITGTPVGPRLKVKLPEAYAKPWPGPEYFPEGIVQMYATAAYSDEPIPVLIGQLNGNGEEVGASNTHSIIDTSGNTIKTVPNESSDGSEFKDKRVEIAILYKVPEGSKLRTEFGPARMFINTQEEWLPQIIQQKSHTVPILKEIFEGDYEAPGFIPPPFVHGIYED